MKKLIATITVGIVLLLGTNVQAEETETIKITKDDPGIMQPMTGGTKPPVTERP